MAVALGLMLDAPAQDADVRALAQALDADFVVTGSLTELAGRFSVDVVWMQDCKGPHHVHPKGEIGMIMPVEGDAEFDDIPRGWYVHEAGSAHWPTVTKGSAYILYLLPDGEIEFTGK